MSYRFLQPVAAECTVDRFKFVCLVTTGFSLLDGDNKLHGSVAARTIFPVQWIPIAVVILNGNFVLSHLNHTLTINRLRFLGVRFR